MCHCSLGLSGHSLLKSGFLPNEEKSVWDPTQVITLLGAVINTSQCVIKATDKRVDSLINDSSSLLSSERSLHQVPARELRRERH